jgi:hypothetical protein
MFAKSFHVRLGKVAPPFLFTVNINLLFPFLSTCLTHVTEFFPIPFFLFTIY